MNRFTENWPILGLVLAMFFVALAYIVAFVLMVIAFIISLAQHIIYRVRRSLNER